MKKSPLPLMLISTFFVAVFQSCTGNTTANAEMQKPVAQEATLAANTKTSDDDDDKMNSKDINQDRDQDRDRERDHDGRNAAYSNTGSGTQDATSKNYNDMQEAFKGETTASAKYLAYSKQAEAEGYHEIALLFKATSMSEKIHANNHKAVLEEAGQRVPAITPEFIVKSTKENLKDAIAGETYEINKMYPEFMEDANLAGNQLSLVSLNYAYKTEKKHKPLYENALEALENNSVKSLASVYYVCSTCGNTYDNVVPKRCGISMTSSEKFLKVDNLSL